MTEDKRCCGSGTCIIDAEGRCWCGQQWDGEKMAPAALVPVPAPAPIRESSAHQPSALPQAAPPLGE